jgi:thiol-disulfide isomerase/thioredoxin
VWVVGACAPIKIIAGARKLRRGAVNELRESKDSSVTLRPLGVRSGREQILEEFTLRKHAVRTAIGSLVVAGALLVGPAAAIPSIDGTNPITGKPVKTSSFKGKPLVLTVWASWCPNCNDEAPTVAKVAKQAKGVTFVGVDVEDSASDAKGFYKTHHWNFVSIDDPNRDRQRKLGLPGQPSTVFVNRKGDIVARIIGGGTEQQFKDGIAAAKKK